MKYDIYYKGTLVIEQLEAVSPHQAEMSGWYHAVEDDRSRGEQVKCQDFTATPSEEGN